MVKVIKPTGYSVLWQDVSFLQAARAATHPPSPFTETQRARVRMRSPLEQAIQIAAHRRGLDPLFEYGMFIDGEFYVIGYDDAVNKDSADGSSS